MLGQAHTPRRRLLPFAAFALVVLTAPALGLAGSTQSASSPPAQRLRAENARIEGQKRAAVLELYALEERLGAAQTQLAALGRQASRLRAERASLLAQLGSARRGSRTAQRQLAARLRMLYEQGNVEPLEIVLGAKSLDEALTSIDNLGRVTGQSEDVLRQLRTARRALSGAAGRLAAREAALSNAAARARATAVALAQARSRRAAYIGSLAERRRLNERQISALLAAAQAARERTRKLEAAPPAAAVSPPAPAAPTTGDGPAPLAATAAGTAAPVAATDAAPAPAAAGGRTLTVTASGYALTGRTATGLPVGFGVVAVDPSVIPLGTRLTIPGYGDAVAADTGGSIVGAAIDLWFPTTAQASAWGRRTVTIVLR